MLVWGELAVLEGVLKGSPFFRRGEWLIIDLWKYQH